ncbi:hypothetical protein PPTS312_28720 [Pseudomonas putida]|uniref:Uncharacterized protein n=1 Tax=Pseudomonas putida TaxID=303 RepID=A0A7U6M2Z4_PSEPU|nr:MULTISPECIES: hypothetical protein [Pseudomonas]MDD2124161.1 hypothetical protein [Pseudomonas monteilii]BBU44957.1 hypothetical protein PPTS312_28720 [Pseudomonas putida]
MRDTELDTLRRDAELHNLDTSRVRITPDDGAYLVTFPRPLIALGPWAEHVQPAGAVRCRTAAQAEETMLRGLLKLSIAERQRVRCGFVVGWDSLRINRCPLSDDELDAYRLRIGHAAKVAQLQEELTEALAAQARREAAERGAADLSARHGLTIPTVQSTEHPSLPLSGKKRPRTQRKEVNNHE